MNVRIVKISDVYSGLYDGPHATPPVSESGAVFLGISNITKNGHIDFSNIKYISEEDLPKWTKRVTPKAGDIVFSYEATLNLYAIIPEGFWGCLGRRMALIRPDESKALGKYLYYYFFSDEWRATIAKNTITGATVDRIPIAKFPEFPISLPSIEYQKRIVDALSAYDDLIENNQKQIKLLDEAAQRLYKEWFVDLRFPGHEDVQIVDGVPEGWSEKSMDEIADYLNGYAFKPSDWGERGKPIIKIKELNEGVTKDTPRNSGDSIPKKYTIYSGDIVFSWSATLTAKIWDAEEGLLNQHLFKVTPNKGICREYVLQSILKTLDEFSYLTTGSTMKHIQRGKLKQVFVKVPTQDIMNKFEVLADTYREQILTLKHQLILIQEARDRLLPKLMSGEIEL